MANNAPIISPDVLLLPLSNTATNTLHCMSRIHRESVLRASPFCHESMDGHREVRGWVLDIPANAHASAIPIPYNLFHGVSVAMCEMSEREVLELMQNADDTRKRMGDALKTIMQRALMARGRGEGDEDELDFMAVDEQHEPAHEDGRAGRKKRERSNIHSRDASAEERLADDERSGEHGLRATWARCRPASMNGVPMSLHGATKDKDGNIVFVPDACAIIDSEPWVPELSPDGFVGIYFRWQEDGKGMAGRGSSMRECRLCMYMVCQSYLPSACLEFADMVHRLEDACTAGCVSLSEEIQWLRSACSRNRARLIADVCEEMGIRVPLVEDYCACRSSSSASKKMRRASSREDGRMMALVCTETLHHDLCFIAPSPQQVGCAALNNNFQNFRYGRNESGGAIFLNDYNRCLNEGGGMVRLLNYCAETCKAFNGSVCVMAPWESVWIYLGEGGNRGGKDGDDFGAPHGKKHVVLPSATPCVNQHTLNLLHFKTKGVGLGDGGGRRLAFATLLDPSECKVLDVWTEEEAAAGSTKHHEGKGRGLAIAGGSPPNTGLSGAMGHGGGNNNSNGVAAYARTPSLEDDITAAYRQALAMARASRTMPSPCYHYQHQGMGGDNNNGDAHAKHYLVFDEAVLAHMAMFGWARNQGAAKLIPLGVALYEDWKTRS